jgi:hypothetical protein
MFAGTSVVGVGSTVIVYVRGVPVHPANVGVTETADVIGAEVELPAVKELVLPVPLPVNPIELFEFVQVYVAPAGVLE